ncbi:MAG TPA: hypothetical protein VJ898_14395 [Natrialbaceae archaeon]|nr:hypothetical protein [Natrialbaceae archaeon]
MQLPASLPDPPDLEPHDPDWDDESAYESVDHRRDEIQAVLEDGAWERALHEWAEHTDWDETDFEIARDLGLFEALDFSWDPDAERIEYYTPEVPDDWQDRDLHPGLDSWAVVSKIDAGLSDLGRVVSEVLQAEYVDWESPFPEPDTTVTDEPEEGSGANGEPEPESELVHDPYARERGNGDEIIDEDEFESASDGGSWTFR